MREVQDELDGLPPSFSDHPQARLLGLCGDFVSEIDDCVRRLRAAYLLLPDELGEILYDFPFGVGGDGWHEVCVGWLFTVRPYPMA